MLGVKRFRKSKEETRLLLEKNAHMLVAERFCLGYGSNIEVFANAYLVLIIVEQTVILQLSVGKE